MKPGRSDSRGGGHRNTVGEPATVQEPIPEPIPGPIPLSGPRLRPTASAGAIFAIGLGALPAAALGLDVAWVVVASAVSVLLISPWVALRQVTSIEAVGRAPSVSVSDGRTSWTLLSVRTRRRARDLLLALTVPTASGVERERAPRLAVLETQPGASTSFACPLRLGQRGRHDALIALAVSSFPFGLFVASRRIRLPGEVCVFPRVFDRRDRRLDRWMLTLSFGADEPRHGRPMTRSPGLPMTVRSARTGDTARDLAWRHSARRLRWLALDRAPTTHARVEVILVRAVYTSGRGGPAAYTTDPRGPWSVGRREQAFEWAVRATATLAVQWLRRGLDVTTRVVDAMEGETLGQTLRRVATVQVSSHRPEAHLELLTDVEMQVGAGEGPPGRHEGPATGVTFAVVPIVRTAQWNEPGEAPSRVRRAPGQSHRSVIGVDAVGRLVPLEIGPAHRRARGREAAV